MSICPLCNEDIADNESRVVAFILDKSDGVHHTGQVRTCHRKCAAEKWPEFYQWHPPPKRSP